MRQLFRANIKDEDCRFFLESKGAKMPIGMVDKLIFFLFDVFSSYQESLQLVNFAVTNLKRIVQVDAKNCASENLVPQFSLSLNWLSKTESAFVKNGNVTTSMIQGDLFCRIPYTRCMEDYSSKCLLLWKGILKYLLTQTGERSDLAEELPHIQDCLPQLYYLQKRQNPSTI